MKERLSHPHEKIHDRWKSLETHTITQTLMEEFQMVMKTNFKYETFRLDFILILTLIELYI